MQLPGFNRLDEVIKAGIKIEFFAKNNLIACRVSDVLGFWESEVKTGETTLDALIAAVDGAKEHVAEAQAHYAKVQGKQGV